MNILAISAHPDDEALGCGGTLLRHHAEGDSLHWAIVTQAQSPQWSPEVIGRKAREVEAVASGYSMQSVHRVGLPTTQLDAIPFAQVIEGLRTVIEKVRPEIVYLPHHGDVSTDHQVVFAAALSVMKGFYMRKLGVRRILSFETLSSTEAAAPHNCSAFVPNVYIDITPHCEHKIELMSLYATEAHPEPLPRGSSAIRALARFRGATVSVEYAEAFMLIRELM